MILRNHSLAITFLFYFSPSTFMLDKKNQVLFYIVFQIGYSDNTIAQKQQDRLHY